MPSPVVPPTAGAERTPEETFRHARGATTGRIPTARANTHHSAPRPAPEAGPEPAATQGIGQPVSGAIGLALVAAVALLAGVAPGPQGVLERVGPYALFCLPVLTVVALWWDGWPLARRGAAVAGAAGTALILGVGLLATVVGQALVGDADTSHLFGNSTETPPPLAHMTTFPWTVPLAGIVFVVLLQITFVCRKWPFAKLPAPDAGLAAFAASWALGLGIYGLANWDAVPGPLAALLGLNNPGGPVDALDLVAFGLCLAVWQLTFFFLLEGWPVGRLHNQAAYLVVANALTLGGGYLTWLMLDRGFGLAPAEIGAIAGAAVAGLVVTGLLFEGWPARLLRGANAVRAALLGVAALWSLAIGYGLYGLGNAAEDWTREPVQLWTTIMGLTFVGAVVILHVVVWRRWPLASPARGDDPATVSEGADAV